MTWFGWILIVLWCVSPLYTISMIGKPRKAYTNGDAIVSVVITGLLILGAVTVGV